MTNNGYLGYLEVFKKNLYIALCEREKGRDWKKLVDGLVIQLMGVPEEHRTINYYILFYNISTLKYLDYPYYRKIILDSIPLVTKDYEGLNNNE